MPAFAAGAEDDGLGGEDEDTLAVVAEDELDDALFELELDDAAFRAGTSSSTGVELHADSSTAHVISNPNEYLLQMSDIVFAHFSL
ncbi:MAG: hypothetical protein ABUL58_00340 [Steroidobacter sp.]